MFLSMRPVWEGEAPAELNAAKLGGSLALPNPKLLQTFSHYVGRGASALVFLWRTVGTRH